MSRLKALIFNKTFLIIAVLAVMATVDFSSQQRLSQRIEQNKNNPIVSIPTNNSSVSAENSPSVLGETDTQSSPVVQSVPIDQSLTDRFIQIKGNLGSLGAIIQKNGLFALAPNSVDNTIIARRSIETSNLSTNSINSRTIENHSIGSTDLKDDIEIENLTVNGKFKADNIIASNVLYSISGTAHRLTVTSGQNPTLDIASDYAGQSSISTLGTITSGAWHGSPIELAYGGTGATTAAGARTALGLEYASATDVNYYNIATWGDSLTLGMTPVLQGMMPTYSLHNNGVGGESSTQIKNRMLTATDKTNMIATIWAGNNNATDTTTVKADIAAMIANLAPTARYLVIGIDINSAYPLGNSTHTTILQLNADLAALYPNNFFDMHAYVVAHGLADAGITPTSQDNIDIANDIIPTSLRATGGPIHLNTAGYTVVSQQVINFVNTHFLPTTQKTFNYANLADVFKYPAPFGAMNILPGTKINYNNVVLAQASTTLNNYFFAGAGNLTTTGINNLATGYASLTNLTTGYRNNAVGNYALGYNTTGYQNTALGYYNLAINTTGNSNTAIGDEVLVKNITGNNNTAVGFSALSSNTANNNSAFGFNALASNTTGGENIGIGLASLNSNMTGNYNVGVGDNTFQLLTSGSENTAIGHYAGRNIADGSTANATNNKSVYVGSYSKSFASGETNEIVIGYNTIGIGNNSVVLGNSSIVTTALRGNVGIGTTTPSSKLEVSGGDIRVTSGSFIDDGTTLTVPDYVFEADYQRRTMAELQTYIETNKHLPNIPDMNDISGWAKLSLQDRDMKLLEKVEENTLYSIDNYNKIETISNDQLVIIGGNIKDLQKQMTNLSDEQSVETRLIASLRGEVDQNTKDITDLTKQMTDLQTQHQAVIDFAAALEIDSDNNLINFGTWSLSALNISADSINLTGDMSAKNVTASDTVKGDAIQGNSLELGKDASGRGTLKAGETEVVIETVDADKEAKIYVTPTGKLSGRNLYVDYQEIQNGASFTVKLDGEPLEDDIDFNWLIVK